MKNDLNYDLEIKINECEMLNKTLVEMFNKNVSQAQIDLVNDELINKLKEISHIKGKINSLKDIEKEAEEQHCSTDDNFSIKNSTFCFNVIFISKEIL